MSVMHCILVSVLVACSTVSSLILGPRIPSHGSLDSVYSDSNSTRINSTTTGLSTVTPPTNRDVVIAINTGFQKSLAGRGFTLNEIYQVKVLFNKTGSIRDASIAACGFGVPQAQIGVASKHIGDPSWHVDYVTAGQLPQGQTRLNWFSMLSSRYQITQAFDRAVDWARDGHETIQRGVAVTRSVMGVLSPTDQNYYVFTTSTGASVTVGAEDGEVRPVQTQAMAIS